MLAASTFVERLVDLGDEIARSGGPPSPEQRTTMAGLGVRLERYGKIDLTLALIAMATARYW